MTKIQVSPFLVSLFSVFMVACTICYSQSKIEVGIRFIPQATSFRFETPSPAGDLLKITPYDFRVRTAQGLGVVYYPLKRWTLAADILYSLHGGGYKARKTNINYIKVPLLIGYSALAHHRLIFNIQAGIDFGWVASAKMKYNDGETIDILPYIKRTNWGTSFAMGFKVKAHKKYFINTQLFLYVNRQSLAKTSPSFKATDYVFPGLRFSIDLDLLDLK